MDIILCILLINCIISDKKNKHKNKNTKNVNNCLRKYLSNLLIFKKMYIKLINFIQKQINWVQLDNINKTWDHNIQKGTDFIYIHSRGDVAINAHLNTGPGTNTLVFGVLTILMQIAICIIYGILIKLPAYESTDPVGSVNFSNITITILFFFFVLLGNDIFYM